MGGRRHHHYDSDGMRLYLSSYHLGSDPTELRPDRGTGRAAIVLNALDGFGASRGRDLDREQAGLQALGYSCEELDLRDYFFAWDQLKARLAELDLVWVVGGNSFVLARAMTAARFRDALLESGSSGRPGLTYAGYSAGACVAGPDLEGIELVDDPTVAPADYPQDTPARSLSLVPFRIVPHCDSAHPESAAVARVAAQLRAAGLDHRRLRDGEAILIDAGVIVVVGRAPTGP
jgi:dipeptidase E